MEQLSVALMTTFFLYFLTIVGLKVEQLNSRQQHDKEKRIDHSGIESGTILWFWIVDGKEQGIDHSGIESGTILKHAETDEEAVRDHSGIESGTISRFIEGLLRSDFARP